MKRGSARWRRSLVVAVLAGASAVLVASCGSGSPGHSTTTNGPTSSSTTSTTSTLPGTGRPVITLGDKNTTEQFVLGELYDLALSAQGFQVTLTRNIGPPSVSYQALEQGNLNVYPEYLNVWDSQVVADTHQPSSVYNAFYIGQIWASDHQLGLLEPTPGADTNGIAVTAAFAHHNHLRTLADLARLSPTLKIGAPIQFTQSQSGLPALESIYGLTPNSTTTVVIGDQYNDLSTGKIQAAYVQTTDAQLSTPQYKVLGDPRHANGFGNVVPVVTASTLANEGPAFVQTLNQVDALLTTRVLRELNAEVDLQHMDPLDVAKQFLEQHGVVSSATTP